MKEMPDKSVFDALHPFSFITDEDGGILIVGSSLRKIYPEIEKYQNFRDAFVVIQPLLGMVRLKPIDFRDELLVLAHPSDPTAQLRGQVVQLDREGRRFVFSLNPSIVQAGQLSRMGLEISDFVLGDPIFDFLMLLQTQITAQKKVEAVNERLAWDNKVATLLHRLAIDAYEATNLDDVYGIIVSAVCHELGWDVGHVFWIDPDQEESIASSPIWNVSDPEKFHAFHESTTRYRFKHGQGLPGRVVQARKAIWVPNVLVDLDFPRRESLANIDQLTGVGVPVFVSGEVVAVLEFFSEKRFADTEKMLRFFDVLALQVGNAVARYRSAVAEKEHLAALVNASKMVTLGEIAAGVAHEINNPVSTISLISHILRRMAASEQISSQELLVQLSRMNACVEQITHIVSELKSFSRNASQDPLAETRIKDVVDRTLDLCHARFMSQGVELIVGDIPSEWKIRSRPSQISQVLLNLLTNAYDAVSGSEKRWIRLEGTERPDRYELSVSDSGPGIPPDLRRKIMSPFFTTKPPGKGTGLGLSISSSIMREHGGSLTLDEEAPHTRFFLRFPKSPARQD